MKKYAALGLLSLLVGCGDVAEGIQDGIEMERIKDNRKMAKPKLTGELAKMGAFCTDLSLISREIMVLRQKNLSEMETVAQIEPMVETLKANYANNNEQETERIYRLAGLEVKRAYDLSVKAHKQGKENFIDTMQDSSYDACVKNEIKQQ